MNLQEMVDRFGVVLLGVVVSSVCFPFFICILFAAFVSFSGFMVDQLGVTYPHVCWFLLAFIRVWFAKIGHR